QARRLRTVLEHMPEVPAAPAAMHFRTHGEKLAVFRSADGALDRLPEAGPACAAVVFGFGSEERLITAGAQVSARLVVLVERARMRTFGSVLTENAELFRCQLCAPLFSCLGHFESPWCLCCARPS